MTYSVSPASLLSRARLDVLSKVDYVESVLAKSPVHWATLLYRSNLEAFNPFGDFNENGYKRTLEDYEHYFRELILSLQLQGFDGTLSRLPVTKNGIADGAHRLAASLVLGIDLQIERVSDSRQQDYGYRKMRLAGIPQEQIEYMVWRYVQFQESTRAFILTNVGPDIFKSTLDHLGKFAKIQEIYSIEVTLSEIGKRRLIELSYGHLDWWDSELIEPMLAERHIGKEKSNYAIFFDSPRDNELRELKLEIRALTKRSVGFDRQIHGTDTHYETLLLAESLLNRNSRHFMNQAPIGAEHRIRAILAETVDSSDLRSNNPWLIDGSAVLELYGIRAAKDIDFVSADPTFSPTNFDLHNEEYSDNSSSVAEVIYDPRKHFRFRGVKFLTLAELASQKIRRLDGKDKNDINLIGSYLSKSPELASLAQSALKPWQWKLRIQIGRSLERILLVLPSPVQIRIRHILRQLAQLIFGD